MTRATGETAPPAAGGNLAEAWRAIRNDPEIQFAPVDMPDAPQEPTWLQRLLEMLGELFAPLARFVVANWGVIWPILALLAALLIAWLLFRVLRPDARLKRGEADRADVTPSQDAALALLEDADRLAAQGRYDEATHLLLQRSVGQIGEARPDLVEPSTTAREIASQPALPDAARHAFGIIAERVERSLFALRALSADDWQAARAAYADFALSAGRRLSA